MVRALRVKGLNPLPIKKDNMKRKRAEEGEKNLKLFLEMINALQKEKLNSETQIEPTAKENLIVEVKTGKMKINACQDELKEEKSIMKGLDTNIDSCIQGEEECLDKRRRFSTKLNKLEVINENQN
ncbi:hypothetical protein HHI36_006808 [Cryptolaemus montrouzieri]|uniref:Uncharacterized protein n=1 Tax=Cryptolaemus montrouzieri TaxID=559131 RepID=A0ABD2NZH9_9CUCU